MIRTGFLITALMSFSITALSGFFFIPWLRKMKFGQTILDEYLDEHKSKRGTPTMGGFMFYLGIIMSLCLGLMMVSKEMRKISETIFTNESLSLTISIMTALSFGLIGFVDDYIKVAKKQNLGLKPIHKIIGQVAVTVVFLWAQYATGHISTLIRLPFGYTFEIGVLYYPIAFLGIIFMTNAVNLTDGLDGLCSSVTTVSAVGIMMISMAFGFWGNALFSCAVAGGCVGFLVWNYHPAKVFMGDTGSMFLGGAVVAMIWGVNRPEIIIFVGIIYIIEALSVAIQTTYFKITRKIGGKGRRIFRKTPLHHAFQEYGISIIGEPSEELLSRKKGWSEEMIVLFFTLIQRIFSYLAYIGF